MHSEGWNKGSFIASEWIIHTTGIKNNPNSKSVSSHFIPVLHLLTSYVFLFVYFYLMRKKRKNWLQNFFDTIITVTISLMLYVDGASFITFWLMLWRACCLKQPKQIYSHFCCLRWIANQRVPHALLCFSPIQLHLSVRQEVEKKSNFNHMILITFHEI